MKRILTSVVLIPTVLWVMLSGPNWLVFVVVALFAIACQLEFQNIARLPARAGVRVAGVLLGLAILVVPASTANGLLLFTGIGVGTLVCALRVDDLRDVLTFSSVFLFGLVYTFGAWRCALILHDISPWWLLYAVSINWIGDISAFYVGRSFGRHRLAPRISPGKSWEGSAAAMAASVVFGILLLGQFVPEVGPWKAAGISVVANVAGQLGDLAESAMKRGAGMKDSGTLLPGHGGFLDRLDSTLFTLPCVTAYLLLFR